jgi:hypothetical protein
VEDDAQNGPDHVDAHHTTAYLRRFGEAKLCGSFDVFDLIHAKND